MDVTIIQRNKKLVFKAGEGSVLAVAASAGILLNAECNGSSKCGKCKVRLLGGAGSAPNAVEKQFLSQQELDNGWRLACQLAVRNSMVLEIPDQSHQANPWKPAAAFLPSYPPDPAVRKEFVKLSPPGLVDQRADYERLRDSLMIPGRGIDRELLVTLPTKLREAGYSVTVALTQDRIIAVEPGNTTAQSYGLAFDIGTTTVAGWLIDLNSGKIIAGQAKTNLQNLYGPDVIARINHAATVEGLDNLHGRILDTLNPLIGELLKEGTVAYQHIYEAVIVGNTAMAHLFLGVPPVFLGRAPYVPAFSREQVITAKEARLRLLPTCQVTILPNIAGFVGSDTVGVMLATDIEQRPGICLAVDIGTNGEIVLAGRGRLLVCSTAAGPAFEGARIKYGMRAASGAIRNVSINTDGVCVSVIDDINPVGICGSGIVDAVAELLKVGVIEPSGRFVSTEVAQTMPKTLRERVRRGSDGMEFILVKASSGIEDIVLTQQDIRELQLAKGAIFAGIQILLKELGASEEEIAEVLLAGAFGNFMKLESALTIGLIPRVDPTRIKGIGNAAGTGACMALCYQGMFRKAVGLAGRAEHIELSDHPDFQDKFVEALGFPTEGGDCR
jgi:uncharacterized 2Fe-2S/4Fe-4S cluster protein (DUF4445 family)